METRYLPIPDGLSGMRLDSALSRLLGFSRTVAADLIDGGGVIVGGKVASKSDRVVAGALLEVAMPEPVLERKAETIPGMGILYDDDDLVIVDKPSGVAAHPSVGWEGPDVASGLIAAGFRISTSGAQERQGIVSRLDVGTSGAMVVAKSEAAYAGLKESFRSREVRKVYHALVHGHPQVGAGTIDAPIGRHPGNDWKFAVVADGRPAVSHYKVVENLPGTALCEIDLETGRTHQIRVHFAALRHPLVGDLTYGADPTVAARLGLVRQWLHARSLGFAHPVTGDWIEVESRYPDDLQRALDAMRVAVA
ncbi:MAG: RluA family pseudouridine synthase [Promicromonosporaceae bacterium]|nr:RluA family pseudouridine synthase [Promicromonosporaceae bacterium]